LMAEGRRDFICKDWSNAAENFSKACEKLTEEFGDRAAETAEGYFWYGKSLLEVSRNQHDFLGTKAENEDVENQDPEENEQKSLEKIEEKEENGDKAEENAENPEKEAETVEEPENEAENDAEEAENPENEAETLENEEEEEEEDISDQQLAYEMFELARSIYSALMDPTAATEINKAECHMSIGEIAGENGQIEDAIVEYYAALDILEKKLPADRKRRLAEVYTSLGCSQDAIYQYSKSITSFERAVEIM